MALVPVHNTPEGLREDQHGTWNAYKNYHCRCDKCKMINYRVDSMCASSKRYGMTLDEYRRAIGYKSLQEVEAEVRGTTKTFVRPEPVNL